MKHNFFSVELPKHNKIFVPLKFGRNFKIDFPETDLIPHSVYINGLCGCFGLNSDEESGNIDIFNIETDHVGLRLIICIFHHVINQNTTENIPVTRYFASFIDEPESFDFCDEKFDNSGNTLRVNKSMIEQFPSLLKNNKLSITVIE
ncbi:Hypothetical protein HVR_LOCUS946 [uncultured virus]|nr:Hypothetical protein HVR_LOCUS946 [uncultured virus]